MTHQWTHKMMECQWNLWHHISFGWSTSRMVPPEVPEIARKEFFAPLWGRSEGGGELRRDDVTDRWVRPLPVPLLPRLLVRNYHGSDVRDGLRLRGGHPGSLVRHSSARSSQHLHRRSTQTDDPSRSEGWKRLQYLRHVWHRLYELDPDRYQRLAHPGANIQCQSDILPGWMELRPVNLFGDHSHSGI